MTAPSSVEALVLDALYEVGRELSSRLDAIGALDRDDQDCCHRVDDIIASFPYSDRVMRCALEEYRASERDVDAVDLAVALDLLGAACWSRLGVESLNIAYDISSDRIRVDDLDSGVVLYDMAPHELGFDLPDDVVADAMNLN